jgi:hypothetical protein
MRFAAGVDTGAAATWFSAPSPRSRGHQVRFHGYKGGLGAASGRAEDSAVCIEEDARQTTYGVLRHPGRHPAHLFTRRFVVGCVDDLDSRNSATRDSRQHGGVLARETQDGLFSGTKRHPSSGGDRHLRRSGETSRSSSRRSAMRRIWGVPLAYNQVASRWETSRRRPASNRRISSVEVLRLMRDEWEWLSTFLRRPPRQP